MSNLRIRRAISPAVGFVASLFVLPAARADWQLNMPKGVTEISREVYDLHMLILWICVLIGIAVFTTMIVSIIKHRKSRGVEPAKFSHSAQAEFIWTVIPIMILVGMSIPAARTLIKMEDARDPDMSIKITGYQWRWHYDYLDEGIGFYSSLDEQSNAARRKGADLDPYNVPNYLLDVDKPLVVPVNTKVRALITAADVMHAWWVPELAVKKDAIPGFVNEIWFNIEEEGTYRGQCAELCGRDHGFMPVVVVAKSEEDYRAWVGDQKSLAADAAKARENALRQDWDIERLMAKGEAAYNSVCAACHQVGGEGLPPAFPSLIDSPVVRGSIAQHVDIVLNGKPGTAMRAFGHQFDPVELAAIITYQRNAWGNATGDIVQPSYVAARQ